MAKKKKKKQEFDEDDLRCGHVVTDSDYGKVIHVTSHHCILPDGTHIYEF